MNDFDINCDLGEGLGNERELMPFIDSCNIACGGHAGDPDTIKEILQIAIENNVATGAHPSFVDRENFGRKELKIAPELLKEQLIEQIGLVYELATSAGIRLHHVKPHGALYNLAARSETVATTVLEALESFNDDLMIYVPPESVIARLAEEKGLITAKEVFADRGYTEEFKLIPRNEAYAVIDDPEEIEKRFLQMVKLPGLISSSGKTKKLHFQTVCLHGDHPMAIENARRLQKVKKQVCRNHLN